MIHMDGKAYILLKKQYIELSFDNLRAAIEKQNFGAGTFIYLVFGKS